MVARREMVSTDLELRRQRRRVEACAKRGPGREGGRQEGRDEAVRSVGSGILSAEG
jgi:hypothetical protein